MVLLAGVITIDAIVAFVIVNEVEPETPPNVAVTLTVPGDTPDATPLPDRLAIVASEEFQLTRKVRSRVLPSLNVPVALSCNRVPCAMLPAAGVMAIEVRLDAFTLSVVFVLNPLNVPLTVVDPMLLPLAKPLTVIDATAVAEEDHCVTPVTSCWLPSENPAVAVNCWLVPSGIAGFKGAIARDVAVAELTVNVVLPLIPPMVAAMVVWPAATADANPPVGAVLLTVAMALSEDDQATLLVRFCVLLSLYVPVAMN